MVVGLWAKVPALADTGLYEIVPGFIACLVAAVAVSLATRTSDRVEAEFSAAAGRG